MEIKNISVNELKPFKKNNKQHPKKQVQMVADSIKQFGFKNPIIIDKNNEIIAWHGRLLWAKQLGMETVPCIIADDLSEEQVRAYRLLDNRIGDFGEYDIESIMDELKDIGDMQLWLDSLDDLFTDLLPEKENEEAKEDDYEIPEQTVTDIVLWDLFEIGEHRLLCGDSTDSELINKLLQSKKPELLLTDPPYGIGYAGSMKLGQEKHGWKQYEGGWDEKKPESGVLQYLCQITENQIIWGGNYFTDDLPPTMGWLIWDKGQRGFSLADGEMAWTSFNNALRIKEYARAKANQEEKNHPTQKPQEIMNWCFEYADRHSKVEIKLVLDCYLGSGSTMVASHQLKRKCYGMELDPKYCQVIIDRMIKLDPTLEIKKNWLSYNPISNG